MKRVFVDILCLSTRGKGCYLSAIRLLLQTFVGVYRPDELFIVSDDTGFAVIRLSYRLHGGRLHLDEGFVVPTMDVAQLKEQTYHPSDDFYVRMGCCGLRDGQKPMPNFGKTQPYMVVIPQSKEFPSVRSMEFYLSKWVGRAQFVLPGFSRERQGMPAILSAVGESTEGPLIEGRYRFMYMDIKEENYAAAVKRFLDLSRQQDITTFVHIGGFSELVGVVKEYVADREVRVVIEDPSKQKKTEFGTETSAALDKNLKVIFFEARLTHQQLQGLMNRADHVALLCGVWSFLEGLALGKFVCYQAKKQNVYFLKDLKAALLAGVESSDNITAKADARSLIEYGFQFADEPSRAKYEAALRLLKDGDLLKRLTVVCQSVVQSRSGDLPLNLQQGIFATLDPDYKPWNSCVLL